jgi:predicted transcriptional regulator
MTMSGRCGNPMCVCEPCSCEHCGCGVATLGDLERRVMGLLWEKGGELSVRSVAELLPEYAYTTVATVLDRLVHKRLVSRRMVGRTVRFTANGTQGTHAAVLMHEALATSGDVDDALERFTETLSPSEADALAHALRTVKRRRGAAAS